MIYVNLKSQFQQVVTRNTRTELNRKGAGTHGSVHGYPHFVGYFDLHKIYTRKRSYFVTN